MFFDSSFLIMQLKEQQSCAHASTSLSSCSRVLQIDILVHEKSKTRISCYRSVKKVVENKKFINGIYQQYNAMLKNDSERRKGILSKKT